MNNQAVTLTPQRELSIGASDPRGGYADYEVVGGGGGVDFASLRSIIARNRGMMIAIILLALAAGWASIVLTKPVYRAEASIQIEPQGLRILGTENVAPDVSQTESNRLLQTQVDLLNSQATAHHVAQSLGLASNPTFLREAGIDAKGGATPLSARIANELQSRLTVSPPRDTRIIRIGFDSQDPALAAAVANRFADTFIADSQQRRIDTYAYSRSFLQQRLAETKKRLEGSERALLAYARSAGIIDASGAAGATQTDGERRSLTAANLVNINTAYAQARANRVQAQQRYQQAQSTPTMSLPEVLSNPAIQAMTERRAELESAYEEERARRMDAHPAIIQAAARLAEMDRQIATMASGIRNTIGEQYRVAQAQENALNANIGQLKAATFAEQDKGVRYNILKREADTNKNLYNSLLQRFNEVSGQAADTASPISIIDRAQPPASPHYPRPAINMALAGIAGLFIALVAAFGRNKLDEQVHGPARIENDFGVPLLGVVPALKHETLDHALEDPRSPMAEAHHTICLGLESVARSPNHPVLLLTSSCPTEGKSTTALKLSAHFSAAGKKVLLVDGDMRRGTLHQLLKLPNTSGLADLLSKQRPTSAAIQFCDRYNFDFLARGRSRANPAELLASDRFAQFLEDVSAEYDVVVIDGPPVLGLADAPRLASLTDATLFILEANRTSKQHARIALRRLSEAGAQQIGMVLTKYDPSQDLGDYGYAYSYDYGSDDQDLADDIDDAEEEAVEDGPRVEQADDKPPLVLTA
jgi:capsular exopolysaccharide synthesis family protein